MTVACAESTAEGASWRPSLSGDTSTTTASNFAPQSPQQCCSQQAGSHSCVSLRLPHVGHWSERTGPRVAPAAPRKKFFDPPPRARITSPLDAVIIMIESRRVSHAPAVRFVKAELERDRVLRTFARLAKPAGPPNILIPYALEFSVHTSVPFNGVAILPA